MPLSLVDFFVYFYLGRGLFKGESESTKTSISILTQVVFSIIQNGSKKLFLHWYTFGVDAFDAKYHDGSNCDCFNLF